MARENWEYNTFTHHILRRKGRNYFGQIKDFINEIYKSNKEITGVEIYLIYRLESSIKQTTYRYIANIEHAIIAAIESSKPNLESTGILHKASITELFKILNTNKTTIALSKSAKVKLTDTQKNSAFDYINSLEIFKENINSKNFKKEICEFRNVIQHFNWFLKDDNKEMIKSFINILGNDYKMSFKLNILSIFFKTFSYYGVDISESVWKYLKSTFEISKTNKTIKKFLLKYEEIKKQNLKEKPWYTPRLKLSEEIDDYIREYIFDRTIELNREQAYEYFQKDPEKSKSLPKSIAEGFDNWKLEEKNEKHRVKLREELEEIKISPYFSNDIKQLFSEDKINSYSNEDLESLLDEVKKEINQKTKSDESKSIRNKRRYQKRTNLKKSEIKKPKLNIKTKTKHQNNYAIKLSDELNIYSKSSISEKFPKETNSKFKINSKPKKQKEKSKFKKQLENLGKNNLND